MGNRQPGNHYKRNCTREALTAVGLTVVFATGALAQTAKSEPKIQDRRITFVTQTDTVIGALIRLASGNGIPFGFILGLPGNRTLCEAAEDARFENMHLEQILGSLIDQSRYNWNIERGVVHVFPKNVPALVNYILGHEVPQSSFDKSTMQGAGVVLAGYMVVTLYPGGIAGMIPSNPDAMEIEPLTMEHSSFEEVADFVASRGAKGVWMIYPDKTEIFGKQRDNVGIQILSYVYDRRALDTAASCGPTAR